VKLSIQVLDEKMFEEKLKHLRIYKRLSPDRYFVCAGQQGIVLVPTVTSKNTHIFVFTGFENIDGYTKAIEILRKSGFTVITECNAFTE